MSGANKTRVQKTIVVPINMVFRFLQTKARIQVGLYEQANMRIEGQLCGFDEYMNLVLDDAEEVRMSRVSMGSVRSACGAGRCSIAWPCSTRTFTFAMRMLYLLRVALRCPWPLYLACYVRIPWWRAVLVR